MKKVDAYQLSNGTIVVGKAEAEKAENMLKARKLAHDFAQRYGSYEGRDDIESAIINHTKELKEILALM